jgi:tetratricopeptide (TPR) repeat protein
MKRLSAGAAAMALCLAMGPGGCGKDLAKADDLLARGDFEGAAAIYQKRLDGDPTDGAGTIGLARVRCLEALEHAKAGKDTVDEWNDAVDMLAKAVVIDPAPPGVLPVGKEMVAHALTRAGLKRFEAQDWTGAAEALGKAAENGARSPKLFTTLARAEAKAGRGEAALKAARKAAKAGEGDAAFLREAAGWAKAATMPWIHHNFFCLAEKSKPLGFKFKRPIDITKGLVKKYGALNMINDTLGLFLFNEEVEPKAWGGILEREPLIEDMGKFLGSPPAAFDKKDRPRLGWVVYHYWNTAGVVFAYLGDHDRAKKWFKKASEIDARKIIHPDLKPEAREDELSWAVFNMGLQPM